MTLTTSRNKTYNVDWIDGPTITNGMVMLQMHDTRRLPEIAEEFDGLESMKRESENQGDKEFVGFTVLQRIARVSKDVVLIALGKEE